MEKYTIKSTFTVGNQIVHVNMIKRNEILGVAFPIKFAQVLSPGTRVGVFSVWGNNEMRVAYKFGDNLYFAMSPYDHMHAYAAYSSLPGLRNLSFDRVRFRRALRSALRKSGISMRGSLCQKMIRLHEQNQK